jgi:hypothetical protein
VIFDFGQNNRSQPMNLQNVVVVVDDAVGMVLVEIRVER